MITLCKQFKITNIREEMEGRKFAIYDVLWIEQKEPDLMVYFAIVDDTNHKLVRVREDHCTLIA